jgi:hypothetical protein
VLVGLVATGSSLEEQAPTDSDTAATASRPLPSIGERERIVFSFAWRFDAQQPSEVPR